jgi:hypothetical protein
VFYSIAARAKNCIPNKPGCIGPIDGTFGVALKSVALKSVPQATIFNFHSCQQEYFVECPVLYIGEAV